MKVSEDALNDRNGQTIFAALFQGVFRTQPMADDELFEVIELSTRLTLSLLIIDGPVKRGPGELCVFLRRRLLPSVNFNAEAGSP